MVLVRKSRLGIPRSGPGLADLAGPWLRNHRTGHHWYFTGQTMVSMALSSVFSAMEVVPLVLLTLDATHFVRLTRGHCDVCGKAIGFPHKWTFYFLIAVGVWNFIGAGLFGFLINLPSPRGPHCGPSCCRSSAAR